MKVKFLVASSGQYWDRSCQVDFSCCNRIQGVCSNIIVIRKITTGEHYRSGASSKRQQLTLLNRFIGLEDYRTAFFKLNHNLNQNFDIQEEVSHHCVLNRPLHPTFCDLEQFPLKEQSPQVILHAI